MEQKIELRDSLKHQPMLDFLPPPRTVEEWNSVVAWHMGKSNGSDIDPVMKQVWEEWKTRAAALRHA